MLDSGFYSFAILSKIMGRPAHFIIPAKENQRPKVLRVLGQSDYLCQIQDSYDKKTIDVRVVFVQRNGFRRRRLVTSLLDPVQFSASELALLYHMRWDIETFYRDFKCALRATSWHCQTPETFHQELVVHMIVCCLVRTAILEARRLVNLPVAQISFTRALTETRLFLKLLLAVTDVQLWVSIWAEHARCCAQYRVRSKPDRQFSRDQQECRRKSRGLEKRRRGRKRKYEGESPVLQPETRKDAKGQEFLLS